MEGCHENMNIPEHIFRHAMVQAGRYFEHGRQINTPETTIEDVN